jgi:hypothetical protein
MTVSITHTKVSTIPDGPDTTIVRPSDWNATHTLVGLGTAAELDAGVANGVATLDNSGKIPVSELPAVVLGGLSYQGTWNASTNTPTLASGVGTKGYYYVVSVAGSTNLDGITDWKVGDWAVYNGTAWQKVDNTDQVTSVNGQTGAVVLTTTNVAEGTNEYFTTAKARASVSAGTAITYDNGTGVITNSAPDQTVVLTAGTGISTSGTYPNFTITNTSPSLGGDVVGPASATDNAVARFDATTGKLIQNSVVLIGDTGSITGVNALTVQSLTVNNNATLGSSNTDTLEVNSRITTDLEPNANNAKDIGTSGRNWRDGFFGRTLQTVNLEVSGTTSFDGSQGTSGQVLTSAGTGATPTWTTPTTGTVTSVTGTAPVVSSGGTAPAISMAAATASVDGYLTSTDWNTFNSKGSGTVTSVSATTPITSTGGTTPTIAMPAATTSVSGYLTSTDWTTFNNKGSGSVTSVAATVPAFLSVTGSPITSSGTLAISYSGTALPIANGGTNATTSTTAFNNLAPTQTSNSGKFLTTDGTNTSWATVSASAAGSNTQVQYNNSGAFGASSSFTFDGTTLAVPSVNSSNTFGFKNRLINGEMKIDQRNAGAAQTITAAAALAYTIDRWYAYCTGANVTGQQVAGSGNNQYNYQFTGAASVTAINFAQRIESFNSYDLAGQTCTLSVNLSNSLLTTVTWTASYANTADTFGTIASPTVTSIATGTFTVNSTLTNYSVNIAIPSAATTGIQIVFSVGAQTSGTWVIGNAQLEVGSTATSFDVRDYGRELNLCQRYYYRLYPNGANKYFTTAGTITNTTSCQSFGVFPVPMRIVPTALEQSGTAGNYTVLEVGLTLTVCSAVPLYMVEPTTTTTYGVFASVSAGLVSGRFAVLVATAAGPYLGWSAEL